MPYQKEYFYFVSYEGENAQSKCRGNVRVWWDVKVNCEEEFLKIQAHVKSGAVDSSNKQGGLKQPMIEDDIIIMHITLLN